MFAYLLIPFSLIANPVLSAPSDSYLIDRIEDHVLDNVYIYVKQWLGLDAGRYLTQDNFFSYVGPNPHYVNYVNEYFEDTQTPIENQNSINHTLFKALIRVICNKIDVKPMRFTKRLSSMIELEKERLQNLNRRP